MFQAVYNTLYLDGLKIAAVQNTRHVFDHSVQFRSGDFVDYLRYLSMIQCTVFIHNYATTPNIVR